MWKYKKAEKKFAILNGTVKIHIEESYFYKVWSSIT